MKEFPGEFNLFGDSFVRIPGHAILVHQRAITDFFASEYATTNPAILWITSDLELPPGSHDQFPAAIREGGFDRLRELIMCPFGLDTELLASDWKPDYGWATTLRSMSEHQMTDYLRNGAESLGIPHLQACPECRSRFYEAVSAKAKRYASNYCLLLTEVEALADALTTGMTDHYAWEHAKSCSACRLLLRRRLTPFCEQLIDHVDSVLHNLDDTVNAEIRIRKPAVEVEIIASPTKMSVQFFPKKGPLETLWPIKGLMLTSTNMVGSSRVITGPWTLDTVWPNFEIPRSEGYFVFHLEYR